MINEDQLEQLCLDWFRQGGYEYTNGYDIAHDGESPEREDYIQVLLTARLLSALQRINPQITFDSISHLPVIVPGHEIQSRFMDSLDPIIGKQETTLSDLRDLLLPKLLSGEIQLSAFSQLEEAV